MTSIGPIRNVGGSPERGLGPHDLSPVSPLSQSSPENAPPKIPTVSETSPHHQAGTRRLTTVNFPLAPQAANAMNTPSDSDKPQSTAPALPEQSREKGLVTPPIIKPLSFPLPDRVNTFVHGIPQTAEEGLEKLRGFATQQAEAANTMVTRLSSLDHPPTADDWREEYNQLTNWRFELAVDSGGHRFGKGIPFEAERIRLPITDDSPNRDRIGRNGRLRANPEWNEERQTWEGGEPTPASELMENVGELVRARFDEEGNNTDELQNTVRLPDGRIVNGNRLVRGEAARQIALQMKEQVRQERGDDKVTQFDTGGDIMFTVSATQADREAMFTAAMNEIANQQPGQTSFDTWANNAYLLYQAPKNKRGSDAVIRTFIVAAGTLLLGTPPLLPQDIDLKANTVGQGNFVDYLRQHSSHHPPGDNPVAEYVLSSVDTYRGLHAPTLAEFRQALAVAISNSTVGDPVGGGTMFLVNKLADAPNLVIKRLKTDELPPDTPADTIWKNLCREYDIAKKYLGDKFTLYSEFIVLDKNLRREPEIKPGKEYIQVQEEREGTDYTNYISEIPNVSPQLKINMIELIKRYEHMMRERYMVIEDQLRIDYEGGTVTAVDTNNLVDYRKLFQGAKKFMQAFYLDPARIKNTDDIITCLITSLPQLESLRGQDYDTISRCLTDGTDQLHERTHAALVNQYPDKEVSSGFADLVKIVAHFSPKRKHNNFIRGIMSKFGITETDLTEPQSIADR